MRIALICQPVKPVPAIRGGAIAIFIDEILPYLSKKHQLTVFSIADPQLPAQEQTKNIMYRRFPKETFDQQVLYALAQDSFDIIHVFNRPKAVARYKHVTPQSRFITSIHGEKFHPKRMSAQQISSFTASIDQVLTVSNYIKQTILKRKPSLRGKVKTLYLGANLERFLPPWSANGKQIRLELRQQLGLTQKKIILFTGQLTEKKGAHLLLPALQEVIQKHPSAHLLLVGSANYGSNLQNDYVRKLQKTAHKLKKHITFTGFISPQEIGKYFTASDLFVCTSQWQEPLARVHYEAMAAGLPIITTNRGGNGEVIQHKQNGLVITNYQQARSFSQAIHYLLEHKQLARKLGQRAQKEATSYYNWQRVSQDLLAHYATIGGEKHARKA